LPSGGEVQWAPKVIPENGSVAKVCDAAERYLAKIG
jgi:hypothetical protein